MKRVFLVVLFLLAATAAHAQEISVVTENWPPYNYEEDGRAKGVVTDVVRAVMDRAGLAYSIKVLPWARAYQEARSHENVMIYSIFRLPNREELFKWIEVPGLAVEMSLFKPAHRRDIDITALDQAKRYQTGVTRDTSTHHYLLSKGFTDNVNLVPLPNERQNILLTLPENKRTDFCTGDRLSLARWLNQTGLNEEYLQEVLPLFEEDIYLAFGLDTKDEVVDRVRRAVRSISQDGTLEAILNRHSPNFATPDN